MPLVNLRVHAANSFRHFVLFVGLALSSASSFAHQPTPLMFDSEGLTFSFALSDTRAELHNGFEWVASATQQGTERSFTARGAGLTVMGIAADAPAILDVAESVAASQTTDTHASLAPQAEGVSTKAGSTCPVAPVSAELVVDGEPTVIGTATPAQIATLTFNGTAGQNLGLGITNVTLAQAPPSDKLSTITVYYPNGVRLEPVYCYADRSSSCNVRLADLPYTGVYTVAIQPPSQAASSSHTVWLSADLTGTLAVNAPTTIIFNRPGQHARYTFSGLAGQLFGLGLTNAYTLPANKEWGASVTNRDSYPLDSAYIQDGKATVSLALPVLPSNDTYEVRVAPKLYFDSATSGSITLTLTQAVEVPLALDGTPNLVTLTLPGQSAIHTFNGTAGQGISIGITDVSPPPTTSSGGVSIQIHNPYGVRIADFVCYPADSVCSWSMHSLEYTGAHSVIVRPQWAGSASSTHKVWLSSNLQRTISLDAPLTLTTTRPGQGVTYSFSGIEGQHLGIALSVAGSTPPSRLWDVYVYHPDGYVLATSLSGSNEPTIGLSLPTLPATGVYKVFLRPRSPQYQGDGTGSITLTVQQAVSGALILDGTPTVLRTMSPGQQALFTFAGLAGQNLSLAITDMDFTTPAWASAEVVVYRPDGTYLRNAYCVSIQSGCQINLTNLPVTGTYRVLAPPAAGVSRASYKGWLSSDVTGTVTLATPVTGSTTRPGQNVRYRFSGTQGQLLRLFVYGFSTSYQVTSPPNQTLIYTIAPPDGLQPINFFGAAPGTSQDVPPMLPVTGDYTILIAPAFSGPITFSTTFILSTR
jgi:large repetitive protein